MVIGNEFVWLHLGKTGGDSTKQMFDCLTGILFADDKSQKEKHFNMNRTDINPELLQNKKIICNIRRLPSWLLSFKQHRIATKNDRLTIEQLCNAAENHIKNYTSVPVDYWLRTEHLPEDFIRVVSNFIEITPQQKSIIRNTHINHRKYHHILKPDEIKYAYENCPTWKKYEDIVYVK